MGNRASVTYPNGTTAAYTYDSLNRLTLLENRKSGGELISSYYYTLGPAGNRLSVAEQSGRTVNYTYDTLYRLTQEAITDPALGNETIGYTYDDFGNRLTKTDSDGTISYTYDANDRMLSEAGPTSIATYSYDDNGNTLSKTEGVDTTFYTYDFENRLVGVNSAAGATAYGYDSDGIRVAKAVGGNITNYLVDHNRPYAQVLEETDNGSLTVSYVYGDDLISQNRGSSYYYLYDGQMSTRQLVDNSEAVLNEYTYDAFGITLGQAGVLANNYMYTGEQFDPNAGFYYLRARYYNQGIGRFATSDTFEGFENDPLTLHKYLYCLNSPVNRNDPSGYISLNELAVNLTIRATIFAIRHPFITTAIGLVANAAMPQEVQDAMMSSGLPGINVLGRTGRAQARAFQLIKTKRFRDFIKKNLSKSGNLWNVAGHQFEEFARKYLFKNAEPGEKLIKHIPDLVWNGITLELKTGRSLGKREIRQLKEFASHTDDFAYVFLLKPTKGTIDKIEKAGGRVVYIFNEMGK